MEIEGKLNLLGQAAQFDICSEAGRPMSSPETPSAPAPVSRHTDPFRYISHVHAQGGRRMPVMKVLQTSACENNCFYCGIQKHNKEVRR